MSSKKVVDLRKKRTLGARLQKSMRALPLRETGKRSPLRARRRRARALYLAVVLVALVGVVYGVSIASYLPQFSVQKVEIRGVEKIRESLAQAYVEALLYDGSYALLSHQNIFLYPRAEIERKVKKYFPRVQRAEISREALLATAITISIREREAFARWCDTATTSCYVMDKMGFVFAPASTSSVPIKNPYTFYGQISSASSSSSANPVGKTYLPGVFGIVALLLERLGQAGFAAHTISTEGEHDVVIGLEHGFDLYASLDDGAETIVQNLKLVLSSETLRDKQAGLEYIDLRFGNRVYYKFEGEEQQTAQ